MQIIFIIYLFLFLIIYLSPIIIVIDCNYVFLQIFQTFLFTNNKNRKKKNPLVKKYFSLLKHILSHVSQFPHKKPSHL